MLENKVIIYDDSCPMCKLYTYWFVAWGFLKPENRIGFATAPVEITSEIDLVRGRHEIPLYDRQSKETIYGLPALTHILQSRWTWMKPFFDSRVFMWFFYPLYQIITYNRRVIAGCKACCGFDCAPDLNRFYRSVYLVLAAAVVSGVGFILSLALPETATGSRLASFNPVSSAIWLIIAFAIVGLVVGAAKRLTVGSLATWDYAGNHATTVLILSLALLPLALFGPFPAGLAWVLVFTAALLGLEENRRRAAD